MIYERQKTRMLHGLRNRGITDTAVLRAMQQVPREHFVGPGLEFQAYDDKALPIGYGQTISHPYTVALMTHTLQITKGSRVLEIGSGSGYQAAVLNAIGVQVYTVERLKPLGELARKNFDELKLPVISKIGDGTLGWPQFAPFDGILVTAGAPITPEKLLDQIKIGGKLVIPVGNKAEQVLTVFTKTEGSFTVVELETLSFVPLIGENGWK